MSKGGIFTLPMCQEPPLIRVGVACLVCGERVTLSYRGDSATYAAVCDSCREAVLFVKENLEVLRAFASVNERSITGDGPAVVPLGNGTGTAPAGTEQVER